MDFFLYEKKTQIFTKSCYSIKQLVTRACLHLKPLHPCKLHGSSNSEFIRVAAVFFITLIAYRCPPVLCLKLAYERFLLSTRYNHTLMAMWFPVSNIFTLHNKNAIMVKPIKAAFNITNKPLENRYARVYVR